MTDHHQQLRRESSDTFGRNTKADLELLRRINERNDDHSEDLIALVAITAAILIVFGSAAVIICTLW